MMKKYLVFIASMITLSLTASLFASTESISKTYWISKNSDDHVLIKYDHKRRNMIITVDYLLTDGKKGCGISIANCGNARGAASRGDIVLCTPVDDPKILGVSIKSNCDINDPEDEGRTVATGSVEYVTAK